MQLSAHFTLEELTRSQNAARRGIDNTPDAEGVAKLRVLCNGCLEHIRELVGPVVVDSGYRNPEVNALAGGKDDSQHVKCEAADIISPRMPVEELYQIIKKNIAFDQCIQEFGGWVHVSFKETGRRQQCLRATHKNGEAVYEND